MSQYTIFHALVDSGFTLSEAAEAVPILLSIVDGDHDTPPHEWRPAIEAYQPTAADWQDYILWSDRLDRDGWRPREEDHLTWEEWGEYLRWLDHIDRLASWADLPAPGRVTDRDVMTATGCVG